MSKVIKYTIGTVLIIISLAMLVQNNAFEQAEYIDPNEEPTGHIDIPVNLHLFDEHLAELKVSQRTEDMKILPLLVLNPKVCPPCVNNVVDYGELLKEKELFFEPVLVFVNEEEAAVERFIVTTGLTMPFETLRPEDTDSLFHEPSQKLIFVDMHGQTAFYELDIPNVTTPLTYKEEELHDVSIMWKYLFESEPEQASF